MNSKELGLKQKNYVLYVYYLLLFTKLFLNANILRLLLQGLTNFGENDLYPF